MTQPAPGWGAAPQTPAPPPAGSGGQARGRGPLVAVLVGVVVLVASGVGTFSLSGGFGGRVGQSVACGPNQRCIPALSSSAVADALTAEGYECLAGGVGQTCQTQIGPNLYELGLTTSTEDPEQIEAVRANVTYPEDSTPTSTTKAYLAWAASLPYGQDEITVGEVTAWLNEQIDAGQEQAVVLGGYTVNVEEFQPGRIALIVRGA
jgi:hypothetical protein